jgi:hypothetical protein
LNLHANLGIQRDHEQHVRVEQLLQRDRVALGGCFEDLPAHLLRQRRAQVIQCLQQPLRIGAERLPFDVADYRYFLRV